MATPRHQNAGTRSRLESPRAAIALVLALGGLAAAAAGPAAQRAWALEVPYLTGPVNDLAGMLDGTTRDRLQAKLSQFEQETGSQVVVLTIPGLEGESLEDYSVRVAETWKLGRGTANDGVLLLIARADRKMRIEVGYGLEGALTDAMSRRILDNVIRPQFKQGNFGAGIEAGVDAILSIIRGEAPPPELQREPTEAPDIGGCVTPLLMLIIMIVFIAITARTQRRLRRHGAGWSSRGGGSALPWILTLPSSSSGSSRGHSWGSRSGGFGGFHGGGGRFGGGGASGGW